MGPGILSAIAPAGAAGASAVVVWVNRVALASMAGLGAYGVVAWVRAIALWRRAGQPLRARQYLGPVACNVTLLAVSLLSLRLLPPERGLGMLMLLAGLTSLAMPTSWRQSSRGGDQAWPAQPPVPVAVEILTGVGFLVMGLMFLFSPP